MSPRHHVPRWVYGPALVGLGVVVVPLLALLPKVQWSTFARDITEPSTAAALVLSAKSAGIAVLVCVLLGVPLALVIARAPRRPAVVLRTIVTLPLVLPPLVGGVALLAVLGRTGIIGPGLERIGISVPFTPAAVVVAQTFVAMPFLVIAVEGALRSAGTEYEQVAAGLGARRGRILTRITLPLIMPGLLAGVVLAFARSVGEFGATALLAGNKPGVTQTIPMAIYTAFNGVGASRQAALALSVLLIAAALAVLLLFPVARGSSQAAVRGTREANASSGVPVQNPLTVADATPARLGGQARGRELGVNAIFRRRGFELHTNLSIAPGEVVALVGSNAAGKTTLLNLIAGNLRPHSGEVTMGSAVVSTPRKVTPPRYRNVGVLNQQPLLFPHLSVLENVTFGPLSRGVRRAEARSQARAILAQVGMGGSERKKPASLSGGQQQRVALARALATDPAVLLLDEPLAAMDVSAAPAIRWTLGQQIARTRVTTVIVTHDVLDVAGLADRVVVLDGGKVAEDQPVGQFLARPTSAFGAALMGVNVLPDPPSGELLYLRDDELEILEGRDESAESDRAWTGTVALIDASGSRAHIRAEVGGRLVTVSSDLETAKGLMPGDQVRITSPFPAAASGR